MITMLIAVILVSLTFLITDFRRYREVKSLHRAYAVELDLARTSGYGDGFQAGARARGYSDKHGRLIRSH